MRLRDQLQFCFLLLIVGKWTLADKITQKTLKYLRKTLKEENITFVEIQIQMLPLPLLLGFYDKSHVQMKAVKW